MVLESLLAVLALCVAGAAAAADGTPAAGTPFQVFSSGVAGFFEMFGVPVYVAQCFMTMIWNMQKDGENSFAIPTSQQSLHLYVPMF